MKFDEAKKIFNDLKKFEAEIPRVVSEMGAIGQNHFVKSFANQGFTDESLEKWPKRKGDSGKKRGRKNEWGVRSVKSGRAILVKTGRLRRSIRRVGQGKYSVVLLSDVPYATLHNEGLVVTRQNHERHKTVIATVRGNAGFVNGRFTKGRSKKVKLMGEAYQVREHSFKMPKRQFVGYSRIMSNKIQTMIERHVKKVFNE